MLRYNPQWWHFIILDNWRIAIVGREKGNKAALISCLPSYRSYWIKPTRTARQTICSCSLKPDNDTESKRNSWSAWACELLCDPPQQAPQDCSPLSAPLPVQFLLFPSLFLSPVSSPTPCHFQLFTPFPLPFLPLSHCLTISSCCLQYTSCLFSLCEFKCSPVFLSVFISLIFLGFD